MNKLLIITITSIMLLSSLVLANNDPGHDSLYIEEQGSSELNGTLNITEDLRVFGETGVAGLTLYGDGTSPGTGTYIAAAAGGTDWLRLRAPGTLTLKYGGGDQVLIGSSSLATDLNVTGAIYEDNVRVCLSDGTNCLSGGNTGNVSSITANNGITASASTGDIILGLTGQALALHNLGTNGIIVRTSAGNVAARSITGGAGISVSNGDGVSGNPSVAVDATVCRQDGSNCPAFGSGDGNITGAGVTNRLTYWDGAGSIAPLAAGTSGQILQSGGSGLASWSTATYPATTTTNQLLYSSSANTITGLATTNNGVLVTSGAGVPSIATDLPTAVTIGSQYIYRAGGTDVPVTDGGTGASNLGTNQILVGAGASPVQTSADLTWTSGQLSVTGNINATTDICITNGNCLSTVGAGAMDSWSLAVTGVGGTATISDSDTVTFTGGSNINITRSGSTITVDNDAPHVGTNLALTGSGDSRTITSSTGSNVAIPTATTTNAGFMSTSNVTNLNTAYGWGDHSTAGYAGTGDCPSGQVVMNTTTSGVECIAVGTGDGSVTSVGLSAPTGFTVSSSPITTSGTIGLAFDTGYSLPTTASQGQWDTAYTERGSQIGGTGLTWSGGNLNVDASQTQITSLGTIGTGTWEATDIGVPHGGTGVSSLGTNQILYGAGASPVQTSADLTWEAGGLRVTSQGTSTDVIQISSSSDDTIVTISEDASGHGSIAAHDNSGTLRASLYGIGILTLHNSSGTQRTTITADSGSIIYGDLNVSTGNDVCITNGVCLSTVGAGAGTMSSWRLGADTGSDATISNNTLVDIVGGDGISTTISGTTLTITNAFGTSIDLVNNVTGLLPIANGGTNANNAGDARTNLAAAGIGDCPAGQVVQNTTTNGVECTPVSVDTPTLQEVTTQGATSNQQVTFSYLSGANPAVTIGGADNGVLQLGTGTVSTLRSIAGELTLTSGSTEILLNDHLQLDTNTIKDSTGTTRLAVGATNTFTGNLNVAGSGALQIGGTETITSGRIGRFAQGSVGAPGVSFTGYTGTGIRAENYISIGDGLSGDVLEVSVDGSNQVIISEYGTVNINGGTSIAKEQLKVVGRNGPSGDAPPALNVTGGQGTGTTGAGGLIEIRAGRGVYGTGTGGGRGGDVFIAAGRGGGDDSVAAQNGGDVIIDGGAKGLSPGGDGGDGNILLATNNDGRVGIGTASPRNLLEVSGFSNNGANPPQIIIADEDTAVGTNNVLGVLNFTTADSAQGAAIQMYSVNNFGTATGLQFLTAPIGGAQTVRMTLTEAGDVDVTGTIKSNDATCLFEGPHGCVIQQNSTCSMLLSPNGNTEVIACN